MAEGMAARLPYRVRNVSATPAASPAETARVAGAWVKTRWSARSDSVPVEWLWTLKRSAWVRRAIRQSSLLVSLDHDTDAALAKLGDVTGDCPVVDHRAVQAIWLSLTRLHLLLDRLAETLGNSSQPNHAEGLLADLAEDARAVAGVPIPDVLWPTARAAAVSRAALSQRQPRPAADLIDATIGLLDWPVEAAAVTGLSASLAVARLWVAAGDDPLPTEGQLAAAAVGALAGADEALISGDGLLASGRLGDAMRLLFHRERHAESLSSPLVNDPEGFLAPLWSSRTHAQLQRTPRGRWGGAGTTSRGLEPTRPRVVVLTGAYGEFHGAVVSTLADVSHVQVVDLGARHPLLRRRVLSSAWLSVLAAMAGREQMAGVATTANDVADLDAAIKGVRASMQDVDVVFSDWADPATVLASHVRPAGVRLVVRIHSLDALDPWFHLVNWSDVDQVIVVSEPFRALVEAMLRVAGATVPVIPLPNLIALSTMDLPKLPGARSTLGLIGWGRRVKDPLWALELLAREPSWRLLFIGPDLVQGVSGRARDYAASVRHRMHLPDVRDRIEVVGWTDHVSRHLQRVGVILSSSRRESWHFGLVEGAASGAVPVVRDWPMIRPLGGARAVFPSEWVVADLDEAEARVRRVTHPAEWESARRTAQDEASRMFDPAVAAGSYRRVILGSRP